MNKLAMLLLCASSRCRGSSAMLLERIRTVTGGEMIFSPKDSLDELVRIMQQAETIVISCCYINTYRQAA